jgi:hypothetical protein
MPPTTPTRAPHDEGWDTAHGPSPSFQLLHGYAPQVLAVIDLWTGAIWFTVLALVAAAAAWGAWRLLHGHQRWLLLLPAVVGVAVLWAAFDTLVLAAVRWERDGVCSGWWQAVPTYMPDGTYNRKPDLCIAPM